jgi:hypothetical protein
MEAGRNWLENLLARNADCAYLRRFGSPRTLDAFREQVPVIHYEDLSEDLQHLQTGAPDVLFMGRPVACEYTSGSSGARKWIVYSAEGLEDFRRNLSPWLANILHRYRIEGGLYFSISPALRAPTQVAGIPLGVPDAACLDAELAACLAARSVAPAELGQIADAETWRRRTLDCLRAARGLEMISVWSPTFLLRLLDDLPEPRTLWPRLKFVSCWTSAASRPYAEALKRRLPPGVVLQGKGLVSTEAVVTTPDARGRPTLVSHGLTEFLDEQDLRLAETLQPGCEYEVVVTTASGLYRYRTGDRVRMRARQRATGRPILEFVGRAATQDLTGEKISERFAVRCLHAALGERSRGFAALVADERLPGYWLFSAEALPDEALAEVEKRLFDNPHYAYARRLGQLRPLAARHWPDVLQALEAAHCQRGGRLGDFKPRALYAWQEIFSQETGSQAHRPAIASAAG